MAKRNVLADKLTSIAMRQLAVSYQFKLPRVNQIRKFRNLYNGKTARQLRIRYNVPIPIFAGMIDTLQADLDDDVILKFQETDPADWKAVMKANAALEKESQSMRPGAKWSQKFRQARQECLFSGRGTLKYYASSENGYTSNLDVVPFEDFFFEPKGGGQLENHLFCGQINIWKTNKDLEDGADEGVYDKKQVEELTSMEGNTSKASPMWENYDFAARFLSLNLVPESANYVGEEIHSLVEWCMTYEGNRWYILFDARSGQWVRFEKLTDVFSNGYYPFMSFASHEDPKNFASKGFSDDLYPHAVAMTDFFNEDLENRKRRNSNARAYDKDMFPNVAQLDEAQMGRDRLVSVDTKGGTRRISEGIYAFETPEITGTIDMLRYMEDLAGRNYGVTDIQQGAAQSASKKVGVAYAELSQVSKRLAFEAQPFIEAGQELGLRFLGGLKDYLREPMSIKMLGEAGYEWETLRRLDLNFKRNPEVSVVSQSRENRMNELAKAKRQEALAMLAQSPNVNSRVRDEFIARDIGGYSEAEIALLLDPNTQADKTTIAETSAAIQDLMKGKIPPLNYNATGYFLDRLLQFVKRHRDDPKVKKNEQKFYDYIALHEQIAGDNEEKRANMEAMRAGMPTMGDQGRQPFSTPQNFGVPQNMPPSVTQAINAQPA